MLKIGLKALKNVVWKQQKKIKGCKILKMTNLMRKILMEIKLKIRKLS
jgi:hypothetical protein